MGWIKALSYNNFVTLDGSLQLCESPIKGDNSWSVLIALWHSTYLLSATYVSDAGLGIGEATLSKTRQGLDIPWAPCPVEEKDINQIISVMQL